MSISFSAGGPNPLFLSRKFITVENATKFLDFTGPCHWKFPMNGLHYAENTSFLSA